MPASEDPAAQLRLALDALEGKPAPQAEPFMLWALGHMRDAVVIRHHRKGVTSVSYDPTGALLVTGGLDHRVIVSDAANGEKLASIDIGVPPRFRPGGPQFDESGNLIAIVGLDGKAYVWLWRQGVVPEPLPFSLQTPVSRALLVPGNRLLSGHMNGTVRLTRLDQLDDPLVLLRQPTGDPIASLAVSHDSPHVAAATRSGALYLWDPTTSDRPIVLPSHEGWVNALTFGPGGLMLASASDDAKIHLYAVNDGHLQATLTHHFDRVNYVAFNNAGTRLVSASADKTGTVVDAATGEPLMTFDDADDELQECRYSPDGLRVAAIGADGIGRVYHASGGHPLFELHHLGPISSCGWSPDSRRLSTASFDHLARAWDLHDGPVLPHPARVNTVATNADCTKLVTACEDGRWRVWALPDGELLAVGAEQQGAANSAVFSPDGQLLLIAGQDGNARVLPWQAPGPSILLPHAFEVDSGLFGQSGDVAVTSTRREASVWNVPNQQRIATVGPSDAERAVNPFIAIIWVAVNGDLSRVVTAHYDEKARVYNPGTGAQVGVLDTGGINYTVAYSQDYETIFLSCGDGTVRLYNADDLQQRHVLVAPSGQLRSAALSLGGHIAIGGDASGTLIFWDVHSEQVVRVVKQHTDSVNALAWCGNGLIASASDDGMVKLLQLESHESPGDLLAAARQRAQSVTAAH
jgi:WD40 repeat protein